MITRFLLWLHAKLTRVLTSRGALPTATAVHGIEALNIPEWSEAEADAPLPPEILDALRSMRSVPVQELASFPDTPNGERFVVWTRGTVDTITNDGKVAGKAWERVTLRAGIHRFWDRTHHAGIPRGLRTELRIPLG